MRAFSHSSFWIALSFQLSTSVIIPAHLDNMGYFSYSEISNEQPWLHMAASFLFTVPCDRTDSKIQGNGMLLSVRKMASISLSQNQNRNYRFIVNFRSWPYEKKQLRKGGEEERKREKRGREGGRMQAAVSTQAPEHLRLLLMCRKKEQKMRPWAEVESKIQSSVELCAAQISEF